MSGPKVVDIGANSAVGNALHIADMLDEIAAEIRAGERPSLRRMMIVSLDGIAVSLRIRGERANAMEGVGMLEYAKSEIMRVEDDE